MKVILTSKTTGLSSVHNFSELLQLRVEDVECFFYDVVPFDLSSVRDEQEALHTSSPINEYGDNWHVYEGKGRIKIELAHQPDKATQEVLEGFGFHWSRYSAAYARRATEGAYQAVRRVIEILQPIYN